MPEYITDKNEILTNQAVLEKYQNRNVNSEAYDVSSRLFNSPFHFLETADLPINTEVGLGRKYMENISSNAAIVFMLPGKADYLPGSSEAKKDALKNVLEGGSTRESLALDDLIKNGVQDKYFEFATDYAGYMSHVNILCRAIAVLLEIGDDAGPDGKTKLKYYNWHNFKYKNFVKKQNSTTIFEKISDNLSNVNEVLFGDFQYTQFYADVNQSVSESFSNSTQESKLKGILDTGSDMAKELSFLTNAAAIDASDDLMAAAGKSLEEIAEKLGSDNGFMERIAGAASTILQGANIIFPEIWSGSSYHKTYNLTFNLISPYADKYSMYLNVFVPLMHLLVFVLPKQINANSFGAPYMIRAFSKGWFSCQMGIVESLTIERGDEWSVDGLPTNLKVNMSIKDLYNDLMITGAEHPVLFFSNAGIMDFLGVLCGLDLSKPNFLRQIDLITALVLGKWKPDMWIDRGFDKFMDGVRNITANLWKNI